MAPRESSQALVRSRNASHCSCRFGPGGERIHRPAGKEARPEPIIAKISQETLAEMIGTTRSRVSFFMNKFRRLGFVDYNGGGLEVHSSLLNVVLHD